MDNIRVWIDGGIGGATLYMNRKNKIQMIVHSEKKEDTKAVARISIGQNEEGEATIKVYVPEGASKRVEIIEV